MPKLSERGVAHLLLLLLLVAGLIVGVYLIQKGPLNFLPKAGGSRPVGSETSFTLVGPTGCTAGILCALYGQHASQEEFAVNLYVRSDIETANLFAAKMRFPKDLIEVASIKTGQDNGGEGQSCGGIAGTACPTGYSCKLNGNHPDASGVCVRESVGDSEGGGVSISRGGGNKYFISNWVENFYDNNTGEISLVGGVAAPGYQTQVGGESALMATIIFRAKAIGKGSVTFTDVSEILSNLNNINILTIKRPYDFTVDVKPSPTPIPTPIGKCIYSSTQARLQKDLSDPWASSKTIGVGDKIRVGGFHNNTGLLAPDVKLNVNGPECSSNSNPCSGVSIMPANGDFINPPAPGTYTLKVTTQGQSGPACEDAAAFQVQKCTPRPACLDANPPCLLTPPLEGGWCSPASPTPMPKPPKGDGNKDGSIDLIDMSVIHTDWMKTKDSPNFRDGIDMNSDGVINTFDFALHRQLLLSLGVIKGNGPPLGR